MNSSAQMDRRIAGNDTQYAQESFKIDRFHLPQKNSCFNERPDWITGSDRRYHHNPAHTDGCYDKKD
jgi:hypothetical protein